jgi:hypothetical protein
MKKSVINKMLGVLGSECAPLVTTEQEQPEINIETNFILANTG